MSHSTVGILCDTENLSYSLLENYLVEWSLHHGSIGKLVGKNNIAATKILQHYAEKQQIEFQAFPTSETKISGFGTTSDYLSTVLIVCNCDEVIVVTETEVPDNILKLVESCGVAYKIIKVHTSLV
ncbi:unnamed protein product [marine sediment metagenome]|uniref:Uncharacterized protein n=1 Tax=marine sediment metagenome TaxID=412755 RepID=X1BUY1_9ZZZZ